MGLAADATRPADAAQVRSKVKITVATATPSAKSKVEAAGGAIIAPAAE